MLDLSEICYGVFHKCLFPHITENHDLFLSGYAESNGMDSDILVEDFMFVLYSLIGGIMKWGDESLCLLLLIVTVFQIYYLEWFVVMGLWCSGYHV